MPARPTTRTALAVPALALLAACAGGGAAAPVRREDSYSLQVLELRDAALNARDPDGASRAYAPDAVVVEAETARIVLRGREEIRAAHARYLDACPRARLEVVDRSYAERGRIVTDVERVRCDWSPPVEGWVRYEVAGGSIVRVLAHRSPPFGG